MTIDEYYDQVPDEASKQLQALRSLILGMLEEPEETISYQIPHFLSKDKRVVAIGGWRQHVALYPLSNGVMKNFAEEASGYKTSAGTIQFPLDQKLPEELIKKIVKYRMSELFK